MQSANLQKVERYRAQAQRQKGWLFVSLAVAIVGYIGAAYGGMSSSGWFCLVAAIAASFMVILVGLHMQEQEQTAALLEYMLEIAARRATESAREVSQETPSK